MICSKNVLENDIVPHTLTHRAPPPTQHTPICHCCLEHKRSRPISALRSWGLGVPNLDALLLTVMNKVLNAMKCLIKGLIGNEIVNFDQNFIGYSCQQKENVDNIDFLSATFRQACAVFIVGS